MAPKRWRGFLETPRNLAGYAEIEVPAVHLLRDGQWKKGAVSVNLRRDIDPGHPGHAHVRSTACDRSEKAAHTGRPSCDVRRVLVGF